MDALSRYWAIEAFDQNQNARWEHTKHHRCPMDRVMILRDEDGIHEDRCCLNCYHEVWRHHGAAIVHQHEPEFQQAA